MEVRGNDRMLWPHRAGGCSEAPAQCSGTPGGEARRDAREGVAEDDVDSG